MTSSHVNNFVTDLVEMAKAMDELPKVREQLEAVERENHAYLDMVAERDRTIAERLKMIDELSDRLRKVEAERDSAETMFLELDQKVSMVLGDAKDIGVLVAGLTERLSPPKAPTIQEAIAADPNIVQPPAIFTDTPQASAMGQSDTTPTEPFSATHGGESSGQATSEGQGAVDPTAQAMPSETGSSVTSNTAPPSENASPQSTTVSSNDTPKPYANRRYIDVPGWVSREDWLAGGGTNEDYDYRESSSYHTF